MEPWLKVRNPPNSQAFWTPGEKSLSSLLHSLTSNIETEEKPITLNCRRKRQLLCSLGFPGGSAGKESACNAGDLGSIPGSGRFPWRRERVPSPVFWPGEFHGLYSPFPSPGDLPNPGIKPRSPALQMDSLPAELPGKPVDIYDFQFSIWMKYTSS